MAPKGSKSKVRVARNRSRSEYRIEGWPKASGAETGSLAQFNGLLGMHCTEVYTAHDL
jgi:hypothetical protein